jgi:hypothetical protein
MGFYGLIAYVQSWKSENQMSSAVWKPGDWAIYTKQKFSTVPGPRAQGVVPAAAGETYSYLVDKYWIVESVLEDGSLRLRTRRGKQHTIPPDDPRLRPVRWWERWLLAGRFRAIESSSADDPAPGEN